MNILMLSDHENRGGAAIAASRLATAFLGEGHQVSRLISSSPSEGMPWQSFRLGPARKASLKVLKQLVPEQLFRQSLAGLVRKNLQSMLQELKPDLISVHNLHNQSFYGWDHSLVKVCAEYTNTIWTLHDMWSFTGRCVYNTGCEKYADICDDACPSYFDYPRRNPRFIETQWQQNYECISNSKKLKAVTPSNWMRDCAKKGMWREKDVRTIRNPLPLNIFKAKGIAAKELLPKRIKILLGAYDLMTPRKGVHLAAEALRLFERECEVIVCSSDNAKLPDFGHHKVRRMPKASDSTSMTAIYQSSDIYLHCALEDNLPNQIAEAQSSGLPTVALRIGGVPEMVLEGQTGWLAPEVSAQAVAKTLDRATDDLLADTEWPLRCREFAESMYEEKAIVRQYLDVFNES